MKIVGGAGHRYGEVVENDQQEEKAEANLQASQDEAQPASTLLFLGAKSVDAALAENLGLVRADTLTAKVTVAAGAKGNGFPVGVIDALFPS